MLIVDRGRPVARLEPVTSGVASDDERLARLIRAGIVRARTGKPARSVPSSSPPQAKAGLVRSPPCWTSVAKAVESAVKFWDASALAPLLVAEPTMRALQALAVRNSEGSRVECVSALARLERETALNGRQARAAYDQLDELARGWHEIGPGEMVRETAMRFLGVHPLRAADALQLAAAFVAVENRPSALEVVTLDERRAEAVGKEGFLLREA